MLFYVHYVAVLLFPGRTMGGKRDHRGGGGISHVNYLRDGAVRYVHEFPQARLSRVILTPSFVNAFLMPCERAVFSWVTYAGPSSQWHNGGTVRS